MKLTLEEAIELLFLEGKILDTVSERGAYGVWK